MDIKVCDEQRHGIELLEYHGGPGYEDERLVLENGLTNGLRFLVMDNDSYGHFHIKDAETAKVIASRLLEWSDRISDPPDIDDAIDRKPREG